MKPPIAVFGSQDLNSGALSLEVDFDYPIRLCQVLLHASTNISETVQVKYDSGQGANYDVILDSTDLSSESNYVFRPTGICIIDRNDKFVITCTNSGGSGTVYVTVICVPA